jgi:hypothetical protein
MMNFLLFFFLVCRCNKNNARCCGEEQEEPICSCSLQEHPDETYHCPEQEVSNPAFPNPSQNAENIPASFVSDAAYRK